MSQKVAKEKKYIYSKLYLYTKKPKLREVMPAIRRAGKTQKWKKGGDQPIISFSMNTSNVYFF